MKLLSLLLTVGISFCFACSASAQQHAYIWSSSTGMQDLGTLGGTSSSATAINDNGAVVGDAYLSANRFDHAFIWTAADGMIDLVPDSTTSSQARDINSAGEIVGLIGPGATTQPFFWTASSGLQIIPQPRSAVVGWNIAFEINDTRDVVGRFYASDGLPHAFVWRPGLRVREIANLGGNFGSAAYGINNLGHITGTTSTANGDVVPFLWSQPRGTRLIAADNSLGEGINDNDEVVGYDGTGTGFYWSPTIGVVSLQTLGGDIAIPSAINNSGQIAGHSTNAAGNYHAVIWQNYASAPQDLGTLAGGANSYAAGINNLGQVVGWALVR